VVTTVTTSAGPAECVGSAWSVVRGVLMVSPNQQPRDVGKAQLAGPGEARWQVSFVLWRP
jgi:hypothetical protein